MYQSTLQDFYKNSPPHDNFCVVTTLYPHPGGLPTKVRTRSLTLAKSSFVNMAWNLRITYS